jgi:4-amino-4-deoxychorismate lyase
MCLLFETIKVKEGNFCNLQYHSERMNASRKLLLGSEHCIDLKALLTVPTGCSSGVFKCRVCYDLYIHKIEFEKYKIRKIKTLKLVTADNIDYSYKFSDRSVFEKLKMQSNADEILIGKNGKITDTSFSNIVFFDGKIWYTPDCPLLKGTRRQELLDKNIIRERKICMDDLKKFRKAKLINAMLDFEESPEIEMKNIFGF